VQRVHSDDIAELDAQDPATASVTDIRLNIHRENSFMLNSGGLSTRQLTSLRHPTGTVSYVAWDDTLSGSTGADLPPQKIWKEENLLQFGHTAYHDEVSSKRTFHQSRSLTTRHQETFCNHLIPQPISPVVQSVLYTFYSVHLSYTMYS
jgi:hypothetical protein